MVNIEQIQLIRAEYCFPLYESHRRAAIVALPRLCFAPGCDSPDFSFVLTELNHLLEET
jgi:hypothetical protein